MTLKNSGFGPEFYQKTAKGITCSARSKSKSPLPSSPGFAGDLLKADRDLALLAIRNDAWALQWVTDPKLRKDSELVLPGSVKWGTWDF